MKRKVKLLRRLRITEASLVDNPANPSAEILLWKRADPDEHHDDGEDEPMPEQSYTRADVSEAMLAHASCLYPDESTPEQSLARAVRDGDPLVHRLYKRHAELPPGVVKSGGIAVEQTAGEADLQQTPDMDAAWNELEKVAHGFMERDLKMTKPQAIALACERRGDLYQAYTAAQSEASFALNQRSGTRREL